MFHAQFISRKDNFMKKFFTLMMMLALVFALTACGNKEEPVAEPETAEVAEETAEEATEEVAEEPADISGTYVLTSYDDGTEVQENISEEETGKTVFEKDGTVVSYAADGEVASRGTYTVSGDTVTSVIHPEGAEGEERTLEYAISGDTLTNVWEPEEGVKITTVYTKQ